MPVDHGALLGGRQLSGCDRRRPRDEERGKEQYEHASHGFSLLGYFPYLLQGVRAGLGALAVLLARAAG